MIQKQTKSVNQSKKDSTAGTYERFEPDVLNAFRVMSAKCLQNVSDGKSYRHQP